MPKEKIKFWFDNPNYLYLIIALVSLLIFGAVSLKNPQLSFLTDLSYAMVIILGPFYSSSSKSSFTAHVLLGVAILLMYMTEVHHSFIGCILSSLASLIFFYLLFHKVMLYIWEKEKVNKNSIMASICGYLIIGLTAASVFVFIDANFEGSFQITRNFAYYDFIYFSFITLTSIGYGDIVPIDPLAKMISILLSITGQLYITIVLALIVGKYVSSRPRFGDLHQEEKDKT